MRIIASRIIVYRQHETTIKKAGVKIFLGCILKRHTVIRVLAHILYISHSSISCFNGGSETLLL